MRKNNTFYANRFVLILSRIRFNRVAKFGIRCDESKCVIHINYLSIYQIFYQHSVPFIDLKQNLAYQKHAFSNCKILFHREQIVPKCIKPSKTIRPRHFRKRIHAQNTRNIEFLWIIRLLTKGGEKSVRGCDNRCEKSNRGSWKSDVLALSVCLTWCIIRVLNYFHDEILRIRPVYFSGSISAYSLACLYSFSLFMIGKPFVLFIVFFLYDIEYLI